MTWRAQFECWVEKCETVVGTIYLDPSARLTLSGSKGKPGWVDQNIWGGVHLQVIPVHSGFHGWWLV